MYNGTLSAEEVIHHWQTREVLSKIVNTDLIKSLVFPYRNLSDDPNIFKNELFDDTTQNFVKHFKRDIQNINNGSLPIRKFKRNVGKSNFTLFAQTAYFCVNDNNMLEATNSTSYNTDNQFPDKEAYNKYGNTLVKRMVAYKSRRHAIIEKTKEIASIDILSVGKFIEFQIQNKPKDISNGLTR